MLCVSINGLVILNSSVIVMVNFTLMALANICCATCDSVCDPFCKLLNQKCFINSVKSRKDCCG